MGASILLSYGSSTDEADPLRTPEQILRMVNSNNYDTVYTQVADVNIESFAGSAAPSASAAPSTTGGSGGAVGNGSGDDTATNPAVGRPTSAGASLSLCVLTTSAASRGTVLTLVPLSRFPLEQVPRSALPRLVLLLLPLRPLPPRRARPTSPPRPRPRPTSPPRPRPPRPPSSSPPPSSRPPRASSSRSSPRRPRATW